MAHIRRHPGTGKWQVRYRDPSGRELSRTFTRKPDAESFMAIVEADKARGQWLDPALGRRRFDEWASLWVQSRQHLRASTRASTSSLLNQHVLPYFCTRKAASIQPADVQAFISSLSAKGLSRSTVRHAYLTVRGVLETALDNGAIAKNPCRGIKLPNSEQKEMRFLTAAELDVLADQLPDKWRPMVLLAGYCGMRFSEIAGLRVRNVDLLRRQVRVTETAVEVNGVIHFEPPKSRASARAIAMPKFVADAVETHIASQETSPDDLLFKTDSGQPVRRSNWRGRVWIPAVEASGLGDLRFHDLRHTHAALLIVQGEHPKVIQTRLGHSSIRVTLDTYGHLFDGMDEAAATRLDDIRTAQRADRMRTGEHTNDLSVIAYPEKAQGE